MRRGRRDRQFARAAGGFERVARRRAVVEVRRGERQRDAAGLLLNVRLKRVVIGAGRHVVLNGFREGVTCVGIGGVVVGRADAAIPVEVELVAFQHGGPERIEIGRGRRVRARPELERRDVDDSLRHLAHHGRRLRPSDAVLHRGEAIVFHPDGVHLVRIPDHLDAGDAAGRRAERLADEGEQLRLLGPREQLELDREATVQHVGAGVRHDLRVCPKNTV
mmetsp:Transcript_38401/g.118666  ORF Transcript_38401/g.118666 Transcript_38401/m.118666 type:complete len:220 (-) Transcript_38401:108-767(-)